MTKQQIKTLDKLWTDKVKEKADRKCINCGEEKYLNSHHIITRNNYNTRWRLENGICLCVKCHYLGKESIHSNPLLWESKLNELNINKQELLQLSKGINKMSFENYVSILTEQNEVING